MFQTLLFAFALGQPQNVPPTRAEFDIVKQRLEALETKVRALEGNVPKQMAPVPPVKEVPLTVATYSSTTTQTCTGPGCAQAQQSSEGWYLGKNLGRRR